MFGFRWREAVGGQARTGMPGLVATKACKKRPRGKKAFSLNSHTGGSYRARSGAVQFNNESMLSSIRESCSLEPARSTQHRFLYVHPQMGTRSQYLSPGNEFFLSVVGARSQHVTPRTRGAIPRELLVKKFMSLLTLLAVCGLAPAADEVFDSNGVKIRYVTEGKGVPVVLIHGWMGDSGMWGQDQSGNTKLDTTQSNGFQVIALDCRGHGKSDKPHDQAKYGPEMAADVVRLLDHLKLEKAHLIGYSSGAFIAGMVAATHPERVLSAAYGGGAPRWSRAR